MSYNARYFFLSIAFIPGVFFINYGLVICLSTEAHTGASVLGVIGVVMVVFGITVSCLLFFLLRQVNVKTKYLVLPLIIFSILAFTFCKEKYIKKNDQKSKIQKQSFRCIESQRSFV